MDWKEHKQTIAIIIELIEDPVHPARRNITDYISEMFGYPQDLDEFINSEYAKYPDR